MTTKIDLDDFVATAMADYMVRKPAAIDPPATPSTPVIHAPVSIVAEEVKVMGGFADKFGVVPKNIPDFPVPSYTVHDDMKVHVPKIDEGYVVQVEEAATLVFGIVNNDKVLMTGPTGSGKSSLVKYVCAVLGLPFVRINMSSDIESSALFGMVQVNEKGTYFVDGPLTECVRKGGVVLIDEWELMPPEISMGLQNLLEDDGYLFLKEAPGTSEEKTVVPHANFRIICGGNTVGQGDDTGSYSGTMVQNTATLDRFGIVINLSYLSKEHEVDVITSQTPMKKKEAGELVKLASLVRNAHSQQALNLTMSPRTLINWARKAVALKNTALAFRICYYNKLRESDKKVMIELYNKVFTEKFV